MIKTSTLKEMLEGELNKKLKTFTYDGLYLADSGEEMNPVDNLIPNVRFSFALFDNAADYKPPELDAENPNVVNYYINGIFRMLPGATNEGFGEADYVGTCSATVEFLCPYANLADEDGNAFFVEAIKQLITDTLTHNSSTTTDDGYLITSAFSAPTVGQRRQEPTIGDCVTISLSIAYGIVAGGVASRDLQMYVYYRDGSRTTFENAKADTDIEHWERAYFAQIGFARSSVVEGNTTSDSSGAAKCVVGATRFAISFSGAVRCTAIDVALRKYIFYNNITPIFVKVIIGKETYTRYYKMTFSEGEMSAMLPYAASQTFGLVEV